MGVLDIFKRKKERTVGTNSKIAEAWNIKGIALDKLGKHEEAVEFFDMALEIKFCRKKVESKYYLRRYCVQ